MVGELLLAELRLGLVDPTWDIFFQWVNTIIMFLVMKHFLFEPVNKFMKSRQDEINSEFELAESNKQSALSLKSEYETKLAKVEEEGREILKSYREKAQQKADEMLKETENHILGLKDKATKDIELERRKAIEGVKSEFSNLTILAASKVLSREISATDHKALIDDFISEVGDSNCMN